MSASADIRTPALQLAVAMAIIGTIGAFVTEAGLDPITTVFWRCLFASLFLLVVCHHRGYLSESAISHSNLLLAALGGVCMVLSWTAFFAAFSMTSIATTTIVYHIQPFFVIIMGWVLLRERATLDQIAWVFVAFIGLALASGLVMSASNVDRIWALGVLTALGAAALYASATLLAKRLGAQRPEVTVLCQTIVGAVVLCPFANWTTSIPLHVWPWLVAIGVLHTGVAFVLMYAAYPKLPTALIAGLTFIYPLVAIAVDWLVYGRALDLTQMLGLILIAVGTIAVRLGWRIKLFGRPEQRSRK